MRLAAKESKAGLPKTVRMERDSGCSAPEALRGLPIPLERVKVRGALRRRLGLGGVGFELIRKTGFATCDAPDTHGPSLS